MAEFALQGGIGDGAQHGPLRVGQDHGKTRTRYLLVETLHLGTRDRQQLTQTLL
jgi:hypothetical protein